MKPELNGGNKKNEESVQGSQFIILLLLIPVAALIYGYFQRKYFIPPVDFASFFIFILKTTSISCLVVFVLSFWKCRKYASLVMVLLVSEIFWLMAGLVLLTIVNVKYDHSETTVYEKRLLQIYNSAGSPRHIRVEPWGNQAEWLSIPPYKLAGAQPLKTVVRFTTRKGLLGFEYITSMETIN